MVLADEARPPLAFLIIGITIIIMITTQLSFLSFLSLSLLCHRIFNAVIMILFGKGKKKKEKKNGDDPNDTVTPTAPQHERADRRQLQQHHFISFKGPFVSSLVSKHHTCYSSSRIHHHSQGPKIKLKISTKPCCSPEMGGGRAGGGTPSRPASGREQLARRGPHLAPVHNNGYTVSRPVNQLHSGGSYYAGTMSCAFGDHTPRRRRASSGSIRGKKWAAII